MGQWEKAESAWMIPTLNGVVLGDNPLEPGTKPIYKIAASEVGAFKERYSRFGVDFMPLYSGVVDMERDSNA